MSGIFSRVPKKQVRRTAKHRNIRLEIRSEEGDRTTIGQSLGRYQEKLIMESLSESQDWWGVVAVQDGPGQVVLDGGSVG